MAASKTPSEIIADLRARKLEEQANAIAAASGVTLLAICGKRRTRAVRLARERLWAWVRAKRGLSYPELGELFGRDHTTIRGAILRVGVAKAQPRADAGDGELRIREAS